MMKTCTNCASTLDADSVFCASCGKPIVQTTRCPKCGGTVKADAKFCKHCAFDLSQPTEHAPYTAPSPTPQANLDAETSTLPPQVDADASFQATASSARPDAATDNPASFISPAGAAFAVICFFLPWLKISACNNNRIITGAEFAKQDGSLWLLPLLCVVAIAAYFICKSRRVLFKARPLIIGSAAFALCFFIYKFSNILSANGFFNRQGENKELGTQLRSGSFGMVIGFVLAIVGSVFMRRAVAAARKHDADAVRSTF